MIDNRAAAEQQIADSIENGDASADRYDIAAIADACYGIAGSWDVEAVDAEDFWKLVEQHLRHAVIVWSHDGEDDRAVLAIDGQDVDAEIIEADEDPAPYIEAETRLLDRNGQTRDAVVIVSNLG